MSLSLLVGTTLGISIYSHTEWDQQHTMKSRQALKFGALPVSKPLHTRTSQRSHLIRASWTVRSLGYIPVICSISKILKIHNKYYTISKS